MPHLWNNIMVVTIDELVPAYWKSINTLKSEISRYQDKDYGISKVQKGGNGRKLLIDFDSLPKQVQKPIGDPRKLNHPLEAYYEVDGKAVNFYADFTYPDGTYLEPETQERYIINASVASALIKLGKDRITERLNKGGSVRGITSMLSHDAQSFNKILRAKYNVEHTLPSHHKPFKARMDKFEQIGYIAFVKDAKGASRSNASKVDAKTTSLLNSMFAEQKHKPTATEIHQQYEGFLTGYVELIDPDSGEVHDPKDFKSLSVRTVQGHLTAWENKIGTYSMRSGNSQVLQQLFTPAHSLKQPEFAGSLISIDDRQPPFWYDKGKRVWFYISIDLASEAITTWVHGKSKQGILRDFYRQMVKNYAQWGVNLPAGLECESSLNSSYKNTLLEQGRMFEYVRIESQNARGKRIEAYFGEIRYGLEKKREGWIARPKAISEANQSGSDQPHKIIPYDHIVMNSLQDIMTWNNSPHSKHPEISRWDYFMQNQSPDLKPTNYKAILPYLGDQTDTSCNVGIVKLQGEEWLLGIDGKVATGESLIRLMRQIEGEKIQVNWIRGNDKEIITALAYYNGRYICEIVPKPTYNRAKHEWTETDTEARTQMSAYVETIRFFQKTQVQAVQPMVVVDNRSATISDSFQIPEVASMDTNYIDEPAEVLGDMDFKEKEEWDELDLKDSDEFSWKKSFKV